MTIILTHYITHKKKGLRYLFEDYNLESIIIKSLIIYKNKMNQDNQMPDNPRSAAGGSRLLRAAV